MGFVAFDFSLKSYLGFSEISYGFIESPLFFHIVGLLGLGVVGELAIIQNLWQETLRFD